MNKPFRCVVDASVGIKLYLHDSLSPKVGDLFAHLVDPQTEFFVPDLFYIECANIIWKYVRAGQYSAADIPFDLADLKALSLRVVSTAELMADAVDIAINHQITAYDSSYVALSQKVQAPLLTLDRKLVNALANTSFHIHLFNEFEIPPIS
jgi:predicted nucleic acid-binding protein